MHDLLNNVQAEREQAGLCKTGWMKVLKGTDLLHGITREEEERFDQREYIEIQQGDRKIEHPLSLSPTPTHAHKVSSGGSSDDGRSE